MNASGQRGSAVVKHMWKHCIDFPHVDTKIHVSIIKALRHPTTCMYKTADFLKNITLVNSIKIWNARRRQYVFAGERNYLDKNFKVCG